MLISKIIWFGKTCLAVCDRKCEKAWGINGRRHDPSTLAVLDTRDDDDIAYLADHEVGEAPRDPGTYEGGHSKPLHPTEHNKWCVRECERCDIISKGEEIAMRDFSQRFYNIPSKHGVKNGVIATGEMFEY